MYGRMLIFDLWNRRWIMKTSRVVHRFAVFFKTVVMVKTSLPSKLPPICVDYFWQAAGRLFSNKQHQDQLKSALALALACRKR